MKPLVACLIQARYIAASQEGDVRIKEFLQAITIRQDGRDAGPITVEIACHFRSWQKSIMPIEAAELGEMPLAKLADTIAGWVQGAINRNLLSLSDPPRAGQREGLTVGGVLTYTYDKYCRVVGEGWG